jgi:hypothetical protein
MDEQEYLNMSMSLRLRDINLKFGTLQAKSVEHLTQCLKLANQYDELIKEQSLLRESIENLIKDLDDHEIATGKGIYLQELADASN